MINPREQSWETVLTQDDVGEDSRSPARKVKI